MTDNELSTAIAFTLARCLPNQHGIWFLEYLSLSYSQPIVELPLFQELVVVEAEEGNVDGGDIGSILKHSWTVDTNGCRSSSFETMRALVDDHNDAALTGRTFYRIAMIMFFRQGDRVTFGENIGPRFNCRKSGTIGVSNIGLSIRNVKVVWNSRYLGSNLFGLGGNPPDVSSLLDISPSGPLLSQAAKGERTFG